jgi:hypothetical protein
VPSFEQTIEAQLGGLTVRYADMVRFMFKSGEVRLHQGTGRLVDGNAEEWQGIGRMGRASAIQAGPGGGADEVTFSLVGDEQILANIAGDAEESSGQEVIRYLQFFDVRQFDENGNWVEWRPLDTPLEIFRGIMGPLEVDRQPKLDAAEMWTRVVSVRAVNAFINRRKPPYAYFSHRDQLGRTGSTDNLFINASHMADAKVRWPAQLA